MPTRSKKASYAHASKPWWLLLPTCSCAEVLTTNVKVFLNGNGVLVFEGECQKCNHRCDAELPLAELTEISQGRHHPALLVGGDCIAKLVKPDEPDCPERIKKIPKNDKDKPNIWDIVGQPPEKKKD